MRSRMLAGRNARRRGGAGRAAGEEAAKVVKSLAETYGKIYLIWDPGNQTLPTGNPSVTVLKTK